MSDHIGCHRECWEHAAGFVEKKAAERADASRDILEMIAAKLRLAAVDLEEMPAGIEYERQQMASYVGRRVTRLMERVFDRVLHDPRGPVVDNAVIVGFVRDMVGRIGHDVATGRHMRRADDFDI